jgi:DNA-binding transcriptional LysR family regulator
MDLRQLRYFVEVVEQGSLGKAATRLGLSQPALTKSLRLLEQELEVKLLERSSTGVSATVFGKSVYSHARAVGAELEHTRMEIDRLRGLDHAFVEVGALPSVAGSLLASAVAAASAGASRLAVRIVEKNHFELLPALRRGEFDFVIGLAEQGGGRIGELETGMRRRIILRDRLSIIVRAGHALARRTRVEAEDLAGCPWVFPMIDAVHRPVLEQFFRAAGVEPPLAGIESTSVQFTKSVILQSDHVGVLPAHVMVRELREKLLVPLPVQSDALRRSVAVFYRERHPLSAGARVLIRALEQTCRTLRSGGTG